MIERVVYGRKAGLMQQRSGRVAHFEFPVPRVSLTAAHQFACNLIGVLPGCGQIG